jgi:hypothetical protein
VHKDLVWSRDAGSIWYTSGSMDLTINDWTGAITYAGASSSPSYTVSNGSESINGTFAASGLKVLSRMKSPFSKMHH